MIEESETLAAKAATVEYERLSREVFPNLRLGLLHGAMKPAEKDATMRRFRDHELDILVATSVIEVGIDIPNATVMVIEDADRFGLSQLHQFRGRVGRGKHQSYCYVLSADASVHAQERLDIFRPPTMASGWPRKTCVCAAPATSSACARAAYPNCASPI